MNKSTDPFLKLSMLIKLILCVRKLIRGRSGDDEKIIGFKLCIYSRHIPNNLQEFEFKAIRREE